MLKTLPPHIRTHNSPSRSQPWLWQLRHQHHQPPPTSTTNAGRAPTVRAFRGAWRWCGQSWRVGCRVWVSGFQGLRFRVQGLVY